MEAKLPYTPEEILEMVGDLSIMAAELQQFEEDAKFFNDSYVDLLKRYPDQWVAVHKSEVRATAPTQEEVLDMLSEQGLDSRHVFVGVVETEPKVFIL